MKSVKKVLSIVVCLVMLCLAACGSGSDNAAVSGLTGDWTVRGFYYNGHLLDVNDYDALEDLYDSMRLTINEDGSFVYLNSVFGKKGTVRYLDESDKETLLLDSTESFMYGYENGELIQKPTKEEDPQKFIAYVRDETTLEVSKYDADSGKPAADEDPFIFVLSGQESAYLDSNKTALNSGSSGGSNSNGSPGSSLGSPLGSNLSSNLGSSSDSTQSSTQNDNNKGSGGSDYGSSGGGSSYQSILDEYTAKMEKAVPGLVSEYRSEASGVSDMTRLAEICNDKISELAEICNEGMSKMAGLMNKRGDSYDTYESWANKLMDNYTDIAQEIQDAYLDSAM